MGQIYDKKLLALRAASESFVTMGQSSWSNSLSLLFTSYILEGGEKARAQPLAGFSGEAIASLKAPF